MSIILETYFVISGVKQNGERVFYATDIHSGGWPYWTDLIKNAQTFVSLKNLPIVSTSSYLQQGIDKIEILKLESVATVYDQHSITEELTAEANQEIAKIQKKLEERLSELNVVMESGLYD